MSQNDERPPTASTSLTLRGHRRVALAFAATGLSLFVAACAEQADAGASGDVAENQDPSICGPVNDAQHVNDYNGTLGPSVAFVQSNKRPVGAIETTNADNSSKFCSGALIANDLFLTAGHCVDSTTVGQSVSFNFERAAGSTTLLAQSHFRISQVLEDGLGGVDYAIVRLEGNPGASFGVFPVRQADPAANAAITIIGHPQGEPKQIEAGTVASLSGNSIRYGNLDTLGGNSGSAILDSTGGVVGVHTNGGCTSSGGTNSGMRISRIRAVSNVLTNTTPPPPPPPPPSVNSCVNRCGNFSASLPCQCDSACSQFGDCCADKAQVCG